MTGFATGGFSTGGFFAAGGVGVVTGIVGVPA
jgi:hypothetical protein